MFPGAKVRVDHSWAEAMDYMASPVDAWRMGTARASHGKGGSGDFYAMPTFNAARDAMARGWTDGRRRVEAAMSGAVAGVSQHRIPAFRLDVAGSRPNVPVAVAGDPRCMYRRRPEVALSRPVVEVLCSMGATWHVKPEHLARRGAAILAWLDALEASGWNTALTLVWYSVASTKRASLDYRVALKPPGERFDLDRLSYGLVCPDMLRRTAFAVLEGAPDLQGPMSGNYGIPTDLPKEERGSAVYFGPVMSSGPWMTDASAVENVRAAIMASRPEVLAC
jgi:hypothetical protein